MDIGDSRKSVVKTDISELDMILETCQYNGLFNKGRDKVGRMVIPIVSV